MMHPTTLGGDKLSLVFVEILNARDEKDRKGVCRLLDAFTSKMIALGDVENRRHRQYFYQLLLETYQDKVVRNWGDDLELKNFTLNFLTARYRKHYNV